MKTIKFNKECISYPTNFDDLTVADFLRIYSRLDELDSESNVYFIDFVAVVLDVDFDIAYQLPDTIIPDIRFILDSKLMQSADITKEEKPDTIKINKDLTIVLPDKLIDSQTTIGQAEAFRAITLNIEKKNKTPEIDSLLLSLNSNENYEMSEEQSIEYQKYLFNCYTGNIKKIHELAAIYLQPIIMRTAFSPILAKEIAQALLKCKVYDIFYVAFFLIMKYNSNLVAKIKNFQAKELLNYCQKLKTSLKNAKGTH